MIEVQNNVQLQFEKHELPEDNLPIVRPVDEYLPINLVEEEALPVFPVDEEALPVIPVEPLPFWKIHIQQIIQQKKVEAQKAAEEKEKIEEEITSKLKEIGEKKKSF